jgi:hypothetical protein
VKPVDDVLSIRDEMLAGEVKKQAEKEKAEYQMKAVEAFLQKNSARVEAWYKQNPGRIPPVYFLEKENRVVWLNRKQVRLIQQNQKRLNELGLSHLSRTRAADPTAKKSSLITQTQKEKNDERPREQHRACSVGPETTDDTRDAGGAEEARDCSAGQSDIHGVGV